MANWKITLFYLLAKANFDLNAALIVCVNFGPCPHPSQGISAALTSLWIRIIRAIKAMLMPFSHPIFILSTAQASQFCPLPSFSGHYSDALYNLVSYQSLCDALCHCKRYIFFLNVGWNCKEVMVSANGKFDLLNPTLRNQLYTNKYIIMFTEYFQLLWELLNLKCYGK